MSSPATVVTPHCLEAERAILGTLLIDGERAVDVVDQLSVEDFFRVAHQLVFAAIRELAVAGRSVDFATVSERLGAKRLEEVGGPAYLTGLTDAMFRGVRLDSYIAIVRDRAERARLLTAGRAIVASVEQTEQSSRALVDDAERLIFAVAQRHERKGFVSAERLVAEGMAHVTELIDSTAGPKRGVATGYVDLDDMIKGGLTPGSLVIIAGRPSMGKTALAMNISEYASTHGSVVGMFSLEMSQPEVFLRLVASTGRIDAHRWQSGYASQTDHDRISSAFTRIANSSLWIDDSSTVGVLDVRGKARRHQAEHGLDLLVIDYLQLMQLPRAENRNIAIGDVSRALKLIAKELRLPVVVLSQLSRETERRGGDKKPMMSDLRDSGALEQDADLILFVHRPEYYQATSDNAGVAEIIVAKQRNGPTGTIKLRWSKQWARFDNWSTHVS